MGYLGSTELQKGFQAGWPNLATWILDLTMLAAGFAAAKEGHPHFVSGMNVRVEVLSPTLW